MDGVERAYDYKPKWSLIVLIATFFGIGAAFFAYKAANNDRGLVINRVIELGPGGATAFFWALAACSSGFVVAAALIVYHRVTFRQRVVFKPATLTVPASRWSHREVEISYRDIQSLSVAGIHGQRFLHVIHVSGKHDIVASMLPSKAAFEEVCELLAEKVRGSRSSEPSRDPSTQ